MQVSRTAEISGSGLHLTGIRLRITEQSVFDLSKKDSGEKTLENEIIIFLGKVGDDYSVKRSLIPVGKSKSNYLQLL
jgi:hypothetical protein